MSASSTSLGESLERSVIELIDDAIDCLRDDGALDAERVHDARKRLKESRAILRLLEPSFPGGRRVRLMLRDCGRQLATQRDADATVECFDRITAPLDPSDYDPSDVERLREALVAGSRVALRGMTSVRVTLGAARRDLERWHPETISLDDIRRGLRRTYTAARERMLAAACTRRPRAFHEWRKRSKEQWYQVEELAAPFPEVAGAYEGSLRQLSKTLGDHHDLVMLVETLGPMREGATAIPVIESAAADRMRELEEEAIALGWMIFREVPAKWMRRFGKVARAWKEPSHREENDEGDSAAKEAENVSKPASVVPQAPSEHEIRRPRDGAV